MTTRNADTPAGNSTPGPDDGPTTPTDAAPVEAALLDLIRRPYVAEILAALDQQPHTFAGLRRATGASRRLTAAALRALAGHHAITRLPTTGSWDSTGHPQVRYRLTTAGHDLIERLFDPRVWAALYQAPASTTINGLP